MDITGVGGEEVWKGEERMTLKAFSFSSAEEKKVKSTKVESKVKKDLKNGKGEAKMAEKVKQAETKTTEVGLIKAKPKVKEEKALQTVTKSEKKGKKTQEETDEDLRKVVGKKQREWS